MQSFIVPNGLRAATRRAFWCAAVLGATGLIHAPASAAYCGPAADVSAVSRTALADARLLHLNVQPNDIYSVSIAAPYAEVVISPPAGMISWYYTKSGSVWKRIAVAAVPAAARKRLYPNGNFASCKNPHFANRGASG